MTENSKITVGRSGKSEAAFRTISEVATELDVPQHVLRFWESKFSQVKPLKRGGGRRYYRPEDVKLLKRIRALLYDDGLTIKGVQKLFREHGVKLVIEGQGGAVSISDDARVMPMLGDKNASAPPWLLSELKGIQKLLSSALIKGQD